MKDIYGQTDLSGEQLILRDDGQRGLDDKSTCFTWKSDPSRSTGITDGWSSAMPDGIKKNEILVNAEQWILQEVINARG